MTIKTLKPAQYPLESAVEADHIVMMDSEGNLVKAPVDSNPFGLTKDDIGLENVADIDTTNADNINVIDGEDSTPLTDVISAISGLLDELGLDIDAVESELLGKVDVDGDKVLTDVNFTQALYDKLVGLESSKFKGSYPNLSALESVEGEEGQYADVDMGVDEDVVRYIWDTTDNQWVEQRSAAKLTAAQVLQLYEENSDRNAFTDALLDKLNEIADGATKNATDEDLRDRSTHTGTQAIDTIDELPTQLNAIEVAHGDLDDRVALAELKLGEIEDQATKNQTDAYLVDRSNHTGVQDIDTVDGLPTALSDLVDDIDGLEDGLGSITTRVGVLEDDIITKVDKKEGFGLSERNFTPELKAKLESLESSHFRGTHLRFSDLSGIPDPVPGDYADVDGGEGKKAVRYIWDASDSEWVEQRSATDLTAAQVKTLYEENENTNAFDDNAKDKLSNIADGATKNATDAYLVDRGNHTGTQSIGTISGLNTRLESLETDTGSLQTKTNTLEGRLEPVEDRMAKLDAIAKEATKNATDADLRDRTTHTGTQAIDTVEGLQDYMDDTDGRLDDVELLADNNDARLDAYDKAMEDGARITGFVNKYAGSYTIDGNKLTFHFGDEPLEVYRNGKLYLIDEDLSVRVNHTHGGFYLCYDTDTGEMYVLEEGWPDYSKDVFIAWVNLKLDVINWVGRETHGADRNLVWHATQHLNVGAVWRRGGNMVLNADDTFTFATPIVIADEDIEHTITHSDTPDGEYEQVLESADLPAWYRDNDGWGPNGTSADKFNKYVEDGILVEAQPGEYLTHFVLFTDDSLAPVKFFVSQSAYATKESAVDAGMDSEGLPMPEVVASYKVVIKADANGEWTQEGEYRITSRVSSMTETSHDVKDHDALFGRDEADAHPMSAITGLVAKLNTMLEKANNLSDLVDKAVARTNLGLGDAAVRNVGTVAGTVAAGDHTHGPIEFNLGNVDNTSDMDKPVSTAQQTELNKKVDKTSVKQTTGDSTTDIMSQDAATKYFFTGGMGFANGVVGKIHISSTQPPAGDVEDGDIWIQI